MDDERRAERDEDRLTASGGRSQPAPVGPPQKRRKRRRVAHSNGGTGEHPVYSPPTEEHRKLAVDGLAKARAALDKAESIVYLDDPDQEDQK